jgi:hypothetical protein
MTELDKILEKSIKKNQCLETTGAVTKKGYGQTYYKKSTWPTHRLVFFLTKGIPDTKKLVCHTCDNRKCINIDHLYLGTIFDNARDREERSPNVVKHKTHCKNGHERNSTNTRIKRDSRKECKICGRAASNRYNAKKRK